MMELLTSIGNQLSQFWAASSGEFMSALAGAFFGALAAWYFQQRTEWQKSRDEQHGAIVRAQLALISYLNTLRNIQTQHLAPFRSDPDREKKMVMFFQAPSHLSIDFNALSFLLMTDHPNLVQDLYLAERSYQTAISSLELRNKAVEKMHAQSQLQTMEESGRCIIKVDPRATKLVRDTTDSLFGSVDDAAGKCDSGIKGLKKIGKELFPKKRFLSYEEAPSTEKPLPTG
jgi:hypothetical protein